MQVCLPMHLHLLPQRVRCACYQCAWVPSSIAAPYSLTGNADCPLLISLSNIALWRVSIHSVCAAACTGCPASPQKSTPAH